MKRILTRLILPLLIVGGGGAAAFAMVKSSETAERSTDPPPPPAVEIVELQPSSRSALVAATGIVIPSREITVSPEISGRITYQSPMLVLGGRLAAGETLVKINAKDYSLAIRQRERDVQSANLELEIEKGRGTVAAREWELLGKERAPSAGNLALRKPQLQTAEVGLDAARSGLERAKLDRKRTVLRAPFNATVTAESVEVGEVVAPGSPIATLIGTDQFWIRVSLPLEDLGRIQVPGVHGGEGSKARVLQKLGDDSPLVREGVIIRMVGELEAQTRMAQVLVAVDSPLDPPPGQLPLLPGAFVNVEIEGDTVESVYTVPRAAIVDGRSVWIVDADDTLRTRELTIAWGGQDEVFVSGGLSPGDRLVVSRLPMAVEGLRVVPGAKQPDTTVAAAGEEKGAENG